MLSHDYGGIPRHGSMIWADKIHWLNITLVVAGACTAHLQKVVSWLSMTSIPFNSLLFIIRIRAVFYTSKCIQIFFFVTWLGVVAGAFTQPFCVTWALVDAAHHSSCTPTIVRPYCISSSVIMMVHDSLVLLAITARLTVYQLGPGGSWSEKLKGFFGGKGMPQLPRLWMQTGQQYYL